MKISFFNYSINLSVSKTPKRKAKAGSRKKLKAKSSSRSRFLYKLRLSTVALSIGLGLLVFLSSCATAPPKALSNACGIFEEKGGWYKAAKKSSERWGSPIPIMMAIVHQESRFVAKAKPPRRKILWVIPGPRLSSAYGYSQAKGSTWDWYIESSGNRGADRDKFADAIDFVGWYNNISHKQNNIQPNDAYHLYLAYHEGHGGFNRRTYRNKDWLLGVASKVNSLAQQYAQQLARCEDELDDPWWWPF